VQFVELVERGDVRAMNNIGLMWARGIGVPVPNFNEAMHWWKEAARRGYAVAMNNLGLLYANGQGVSQDYAAALKWWQMAAEKGNAWAMNSVGDLYEHGSGVEQSYTEALNWYRRGAQAGDGLAITAIPSAHYDFAPDAAGNPGPPEPAPLRPTSPGAGRRFTRSGAASTGVECRGCSPLRRPDLGPSGRSGPFPRLPILAALAT